MKKSLSALFIVTALTLTSACGGGGDDRPTKSEVKKAITGKDSIFGGALPKSAADCVAGALVDSKVSDKTLKALVDGDKDYKGTDKDKDALTDLQDDVTKCAAK